MAKNILLLLLILMILILTACETQNDIPIQTTANVTTSPTATSTVTPITTGTQYKTVAPTATHTPTVTSTPTVTPGPTATRTPTTTPTPTATPIPKERQIDLKKAQYNNEISYSNGKYTIGNNFEITFNESINYQFNKYHITYSSTEYIKGYVTYKLNANTYKEEFYLEPGTNITFSSLIDKFFNKHTVNSISKITLSAISNNQGNFELKGIKLEKVDVPNTTIFLQNNHHKIGIDLLWGGGLNYIENLEKKDSTLGNLLNRADTGRLVQQAYYGTLEKPYITGEFNGNVWPYNPVQGGDKYNNSSKIVDFEIESHRIYIKCRPLDWAHNNSATFSYMENEYKLEDNGIIVNNRFVDFSGYKAKPRHQELPAFYVISYLDKFVFYNGTKPWTNDVLTVKPDLPFWGGNSNCYFNVRSGNNETWCAWVDSSDFGIGLYVPGTEILLAGRHAYNGSKDPASGATNYVAPLRTFELKSFNPFEYSYIISSGKLDDMRKTFTDYHNN